MTTKSASILAGMKAAIAAKKAARRHHKPLAREHIIFIARCISDLEDDDERAAATRDFAAVHRMTAGRFDAGHVQFGRITFIGPAAPRRRKNPNTSSTLTGCGGPARRDAGDGTAGHGGGSCYSSPQAGASVGTIWDHRGRRFARRYRRPKRYRHEAEYIVYVDFAAAQISSC
jgi:hypothetical protein